jgi:hypothetical protein
MQSSPRKISARLACAFMAFALTNTAAVAQSSATNQTEGAAAGPQSAAGAQPATGPTSAENEWLAKTSNLYFSSAKAGLTGFNCDIRPDWRALFASANKGAEVPANSAYLDQLNKVKVRMHARMKGGSTVEWLVDSSDGKPPSDDAGGVIDTMHQTVQQILEGFMQFWSPFMEVTVVPPKADGLEITHGPTSHTIHAMQGTTELTEIFNNNLVLEHFNVGLAGTSIKLSPTFEPTPQGLLVKTFAAEILPAGATPAQMQKMQVRVDYQTVNNQKIPGQLNMEISGAGNFNFAFEGCTTDAN